MYICMCLCWNVIKFKTTGKLQMYPNWVVLIVFDGILCVTPALILLPFLTVAHHESGTFVPEKLLSWSMTVYDKKLSSQCNLTVQIEPMQNKIYLITTIYFHQFINYCLTRSRQVSNFMNNLCHCWWTISPRRYHPPSIVSVSALTWFIRYIQFLNIVIIIKTKALLLQT